MEGHYMIDYWLSEYRWALDKGKPINEKEKIILKNKIARLERRKSEICSTPEAKAAWPMKWVKS